MPTIEVEVEVKCERCGADLTMSSSSHRNTHVITIEPCDDCLSKSHDEGYNLAECELAG